GTGLSVILRGLKNITDELTAIVTVADDGGGSGVLREDLGMLPPGDIRSCILAMADEEGIMQELLQYRFQEGMLAGQNFGNLLIAALNGISGSFEDAVTKTADILRVRGRALPVTGADVCLCAELEDGRIIRGESAIPQAVIHSGVPIQRVCLEPAEPAANPAALEAIRQADLIVLGPGSLFTSIVPNLLVKDVARAVTEARGHKIYICNIMTQPGETDDYSLSRHVATVDRYLGEGAIEYVVANSKVLSPLERQPYTRDGSAQVIPTEEDRRFLRDRGVTLIANDFTDIRAGYIRHDAGRIAGILASFAGV
ncbi:MAG: YvcK family protein, partial [Bacillota bacterium]|nr:YvcK family protein [Bacillota bacterium]